MNAIGCRTGPRPARAWLFMVLTLACAGGEPAASDTAAEVTYTNTPGGGRDVRQVPGRPIGTITTAGQLVLMELDTGVIAPANLFDLDGRTLRFTPDGDGYRTENLSLIWEADAGQEIGGGRGARRGAGQADVGRGATTPGRGAGSQSGEVTLTRFAFPYAGREWTSLTVNPLGLITFGGTYDDLGLPRFIHLQSLGRDLAYELPMISVFLKQRMRGTRFVNEHDDRLVVTWDLSEPFGGNQDVTFGPTPHRFQAVLHADGRIDLSYQVITARDAVVGVYPASDASRSPVEPVDLSARTPADAPARILYEAFHHYGLPRPESLACTVIDALGDHFDFMVWYSDFRVDDQEAGTRSVGDIGQNIDGLGPRMDIGRRLADFCSAGRLQVTWYQPVWIGSNQAQERAPDGSLAGYDMAMAQIAHELGHRWSTRTRAIVDDDTIELRGRHDPWGMSGATHWPGGLHAPVPFPRAAARPEASIMGGAHWQPNDDGTYTLLDRGSMVPADGFSFLELYLMGLLPASEVPDFFLLEGTEAAGRDSEGRQLYTAQKRIDITINDVIAHNGPRVPSYEDAPKTFNTAVVAVVLPGQTPSPQLLEGADAIRRHWIDFWSRVMGGRSTMTTSPGQRSSR